MNEWMILLSLYAEFGKTGHFSAYHPSKSLKWGDRKGRESIRWPRDKLDIFSHNIWILLACVPSREFIRVFGLGRKFSTWLMQIEPYFYTVSSFQLELGPNLQHLSLWSLFCPLAGSPFDPALFAHPQFPLSVACITIWNTIHFLILSVYGLSPYIRHKAETIHAMPKENFNIKNCYLIEHA